MFYKKWAQKLLGEDRAYVDPYTPDEVQKFREQAQKDKKAFLYRNHRPNNLNTKWDGSRPLRFKSDPKSYIWTDVIMGKRSAGPEIIDDLIIMKSGGFPTYNFAHIVDDYEMKISHVIRGQEFLSSTPNYLNISEALGIELPKIASVPPIMNQAGGRKLSKRDGARDALQYIEWGIPVPAFLNFLATLGWNDGTEQEIFTINELIKKFSLDRVQSSGAKFDERRLLWISGLHIRDLMSLDELYAEADKYWPDSASSASNQYRRQVLKIIRERLKFYSEIPELSGFFFEDLPLDHQLISNHKQLKKLPDNELSRILEKAKKSINKISNWKTTEIQETLNDLLERLDQKPVVLFSLIRIAITQSPASPGLAETIMVLGKEKVLKRINNQLSVFAGNKH